MGYSILRVGTGRGLAGFKHVPLPESTLQIEARDLSRSTYHVGSVGSSNQFQALEILICPMRLELDHCPQCLALECLAGPVK